MQKVFKIERLQIDSGFKPTTAQKYKKARKARNSKKFQSVVEKKKIEKLIEKQAILHNEEKLLLEKKKQMATIENAEQTMYANGFVEIDFLACTEVPEKQMEDKTDQNQLNDQSDCQQSSNSNMQISSFDMLILR
jgi:hypothetical protein